MAQTKTTRATSLPSTSSLPALPSLPSVRRMRPCACGCSLPTQRTWFPGHDARMKSIILRVVNGVMTLEDVGEWGGEAVMRATARAMADVKLMERWNVNIPEAEVEAAS